MDGMGLAHRRAVGAGHARPGVFPGMGGDGRFPGRRGRRPLRGWLPVDGWPRELAAGYRSPVVVFLSTLGWPYG